MFVQIKRNQFVLIENVSVSHIREDKLNKASHDELYNLFVKIFPEYDEMFDSFVIPITNFNKSIGLFDQHKLIGAYFLGDRTLKEVIELEQATPLENLDRYSELRGIEGICLLVDPEYRNLGLGSKLIRYPQTLGVDFIFGLQYKSLGNINHWLKKRRIVAESDEVYVTLQDF